MCRPIPLHSFAIAALALLGAQSARADVAEWDRVRFDDRPLNVQARFGGATSVGSAGVVGEVDLDDWINLGAGLGTNFLGPVGGAHIRLRPLVFRTSGGGAAHALVVESALSYGKYNGFDMSFLPCEGGSEENPASICYHPRITPEWVPWAQLEAGWEFRARSGFLARATVGGAFLITTPDWKCTVSTGPAPCRHLPDSASPAVTLAAGYAF